MTEFELINALMKDLPRNGSVIVGPGDDCAVLDLGLKEQMLLFKTDAVVEGVHFLPEAEGTRIGRKALARCLSDIAAMGGSPTAAVITLGLPGGFDPKRVLQIYEGINMMAQKYQVAIVGGETVRNPERILISVACLGTVDRSRVIKRKGAREGEAIFVTGELGGSIEGKHFDFEPRVREGSWLGANFPPSAMIDISDGLAADLHHILSASNVGADLRGESIPISHAAKTLAREQSSLKSPLLAALTDGEDFELLFTLPARRAVELNDKWKMAFPGVRLTCIGKISSKAGLRLLDKTSTRTLPPHGFDHFQEPARN